jgi:peptidoglycan hydrolase-like protein with peptidoglycan-binding domain
MKNIITKGMTAVALVIALFGVQIASAAITSQLDFGDRGSQVTELQTYLSTDANIYPSGLVTGYFGSLTQGGVQKFQTAQGIVSSGSPTTTGYGRVGPATMKVLNILMGGVPNNQTSWDTVPVLSNLAVQYTNTSATFTWVTNEATQGQVYFDSFPIRSDEATGPNQQPYVSGTLATDTGGFRNSHSVTVQNLVPNTTYYYLVRGIDSGANLSMTLMQSFRTNQ